MALAALAPFAPYAKMAALSLGAELAPHATRAIQSAAKFGIKKSVPELLEFVKSLSQSQAGRDQLLNIGRGATRQFGTIGGEGIGLLQRAGVFGHGKRAQYEKKLGNITSGLQQALGRLSKINKRFG